MVQRPLGKSGSASIWMNFLSPQDKVPKANILELPNPPNQVWLCLKMFLGMGHNNAGGHQWLNHHLLTSGQASRSREHPGASWACEMKQARHIPPEVGAGVPQTEFVIIPGPAPQVYWRKVTGWKPSLWQISVCPRGRKSGPQRLKVLCLSFFVNKLWDGWHAQSSPGSRGGGSGRGCFAKAAVLSLSPLPAFHTHLSFPLQAFHTRNLSLQTDLVLAERHNLWHISWRCFDNEKELNSGNTWLDFLLSFYNFFFFLEIVLKNQKNPKTTVKYQSSDKSNFEIWCSFSSVGTVDINNSTKYYSHYYIGSITTVHFSRISLQISLQQPLINKMQFTALNVLFKG